MKTLKHFKKSEDVVDCIWDGHLCDFIIIKNESYIVDTSKVDDENIIFRRSQLRKALL